MKTIILSSLLFVLCPTMMQSTCVPNEVGTPTPTPSPSPSPAPTPTPTPSPTPIAEIILDNRDVQVDILSGSWDTADTTDGNGCYGPDFLFHLADQTNIGVVRFNPDIITAGDYVVSIYWSADPNRTTAQPVIVHDANGDTTYSVNLQQHGNQWFQLGTHTFEAGRDSYIEFNTNTPSAGYCNADAVRLVPAS